MGAAQIGALRVSLTAETSAFEAGMKRSQRSAAKTAGYLRTSFHGVGVSLKESLAGLVAGLTAGTILAAGKSALEYAGHLGELADTLGLTTKDLQEFSYAAGQVGISQEELQAGIQKLTISMGKAQLGSKEQVKAFDAIGISLDDLKGKDAGDVFRLIADKLENVTDRSKRAAVEVALFGKAGAKLDNLLSGAQGRLGDLAAAAQKLGIVLSDEQIKNADRTADKLEALKTVLKAQIAGVVSDNADAIYKFASSLEELAVDVAKAVGELARLANWINQNGKPIQDFFAGLSPQHGLLEYGGAAYGALRTGRNPVTAVQGIGGRKDLSGTWAQIMAGNAAFLAQGRTGGGGTVKPFLAGAGRKPKEDHTAEKLAREAYELQKQQLQAEADILDARKELSTDYVEQTSLQIAILDNQRAQYAADLAYQVKQHQLSKGQDGLTEAQAQQLLAQYDIADSLKRQKVVQDEAEQRQKDVQDITQADFDRRRETLQKLSDLAETASERRQIELELLKLAYDQKRQALQYIIDTSHDQAAIENARRDLLTLNQNYALDKQGVIQGTRGPMEQYLASLPTTAAKANEALQQLEVQGFEGLIDAALALSGGFKSAKEALLDTLKQFLLGLARIELQRFAGSFLGGVKLPGFATGGSIMVGGHGGIDRNLLSLNGLPIARVSYGERINISNDNATMRSGWGRNGVTMYVSTPDADSFRRSSGQITRGLKRKLG